MSAAEHVRFDWNPDGMDYEHIIGDADCGGCWTENVACECGGRIHNEFGDENADCDYWLHHKCDRCGE